MGWKRRSSGFFYLSGVLSVAVISLSFDGWLRQAGLSEKVSTLSAHEQRGSAAGRRHASAERVPVWPLSHPVSNLFGISEGMADSLGFLIGYIDGYFANRMGTGMCGERQSLEG